MNKIDEIGVGIPMIKNNEIRVYAALLDIDGIGRPVDEVVAEILHHLNTATEAELKEIRDNDEDLLEEIIERKDTLQKLIGKDKRTVGYHCCEGPVFYDCESCGIWDWCLETDWNLGQGLPHFILENFMACVSPQAFKLFVYLYSKYSENQRLRESPSIMSGITGIQEYHILQYLDELSRYCLIKYSVIEKYRDRAINISLPWYDQIHRLKRKALSTDICISCCP